ncbi:MAG: diaminopimelate decarboxylase [Alphaproteobacteria bacterium]|nr:diaminopimelate decarboxylase [Alphaproteobacteria bacterium]MCB9984124.1 diaminopimelate decarboxylase [Micavibrio sp.]HPQ50233.1 diaminopimelate decarboxylase [Alphaproteobacteria bacterium]
MLTKIARQFGTPIWIYDAEIIRKRIEDLKQFDSTRYAQKACSNIHILRLMREQGVHIDAVSKGEMERAFAAGFTKEQIVYTADLMDHDTIEFIITHNITANVGSIDMLGQLGERHRGHEVWLRINPGFGHGHSQKTNTGGESSKHGIWHTDTQKALAEIKKYDLDLVGIHMHIGSGVDYEHLSQVCNAMTDIIRRENIDVPAISAGGGLSVPYRQDDQSIDLDQYFTLWDAARKNIEKLLGHPVKLEIEPGRYLVAESGKLLCEVRAVKEMGSLHYALVDAGFTELIRPAMYGSYHEITSLSKDGTPINGNPVETVIAGPLCESGDMFTQREGGFVEPRMLPPVQCGDLLTIHNAGAYGASMSSNYNSRPYCPEVLVDGEQITQIRRRQTMAELLALELAV